MYESQMDNSSDIFDKIRIKPRGGAKVAGRGKSAAVETEAVVQCQKEGCMKPGLYKAPMGRGNEGKFWSFCLEHVREYNATYNYFNGMNDSAVATYHKDAMTGHRPTWSMSVNKSGRKTHSAPRSNASEGATWSYKDPLGLFDGQDVAQPTARKAAPVRRTLSPRTRVALDQLGLDDSATPTLIKAKYKELVKRFHPDANGGDRSYEARLQEILKAYDAVKSAGLV
jgi:hypothetical protein